MPQLTPLLLKSLEGSPHQLGGEVLLFDRSPNHLPAAREGGEGYAVPVQCRGARCMLKTYVLPSEQRRLRARFLADVRLDEVFPCFEAAPKTAIVGTIEDPSAGRIEVEGHLATFVEGETLESLLTDNFDPPAVIRCALAGQLCTAVRLLESAQLVHGDLAMNNIMITGLEAQVPTLRLIDFDGFYHPEVEVLPCTRSRGGRGFGQDGYRHRAYRAKDETVVVTSDRPALAALLYEIVCLTSADTAALQRGTLLEQDELDDGRVSVADAISTRWPEGFDLVRRAFECPSPEEAPSPAEWSEALSSRIGVSASAAAPTSVPLAALPPVPIRISEGGELVRRVSLRGAGNSFGSINPKLAWLSYARMSGGDVLLVGVPPGPAVFLVRAGVPSRHVTSVRIALQPGDEIHWDAFLFEVG
jgi:hypothetical protein